MNVPPSQPRRGRPAGLPKTGGRQKGTRNKVAGKRQLVEEAHAQGLETPLDFLLRVMRDRKNGMDLRLNAAKAAAPYMHPALKSVELSAPGGGPVQFEVTLSFE